MAVSGVLAAATGTRTVGLVVPDALRTVLGFTRVGDAGRARADHALVFLTASSMAALTMGVHYIPAALCDWRPFIRRTVPSRLLTCTVFTLAVLAGRAPSAFLGVALWEGLGALATAVALRPENRPKGRADTEGGAVV
jgi:hypothetical protein